MKRLISLICAVMLAVSCIASVSADVIFMPQDSFFESHVDQCEYHNRNYIANGPNGDVKVYKSPESDTVKATIVNGETMYISYVYTDAAQIQWGYYENWETDVSGWVPMAYLELIYDEISFRKEFGDLLMEADGSLAAEHQGKAVKFWNYPNSSEYLEITVSGDYMPQYHMTYTDENGVLWGRVSYYMGLRDKWINLGQPDADYVPHETEPVVETEAPTEPEDVGGTVEEIVPKADHTTTIIIVAVVAVVALTGGLLFVLKRKK